MQDWPRHYHFYCDVLTAVFFQVALSPSTASTIRMASGFLWGESLAIFQAFWGDTWYLWYYTVVHILLIMVNVNGYDMVFMMVNNYLVGGFNLPLWKIMEFVSWDDEIPNIWKHNPNVPNHQPVPDFGAILELDPLSFGQKSLQPSVIYYPMASPINYSDA